MNQTKNIVKMGKEKIRKIKRMSKGKKFLYMEAMQDGRIESYTNMDQEELKKVLKSLKHKLKNQE